MRPEIEQGQLGNQRTVEHARDRAVLVELAVNLGGRVFDPEVVKPSGEHLNERTLSLIVRPGMSLKNARCHGLWIAGHLEPQAGVELTKGAVPATTTNSPGIR